MLTTLLLAKSESGEAMSTDRTRMKQNFMWRTIRTHRMTTKWKRRPYAA
jgi:hypothetical protein